MSKAKQRGLLILFSGPSGCGKGTVLGKVLERRDDTVLSVSVTTRAPREGETDGIQYFFRTREEFDAMVANGEFLEYAVYGNNCYGTPRAYVERLLDEGKNVVLEIEVQGAHKVMQVCPDVVSVFLTVPSMEELEHRLRGRGTETEERIRVRLAAAAAELREIPHYQYLILNDEIDRAAERLNAVIEAEKLRVSRNTQLLEE